MSAVEVDEHHDEVLEQGIANALALLAHDEDDVSGLDAASG